MNHSLISARYAGVRADRAGARRMRLIVTVLAAVSCAPAFGQQGNGNAARVAQGIEAYIGQNALQALYTRNMDVGEFGMNDVRAGFFFNEDRDLILIGDMMVDVGRSERRPNWALDVGPRVYGALLSTENQDIFAIAFGGELSYFFGTARTTSVSISAFYAPDIITFGNADNVRDASIRFETRLTEATRIFVGYRSFEFDLPDVRKVDDGVDIGVRYRF